MPTPTSAHDLALLLKLIADETRLRILGSLATAPRTGKELASDLDLTPPTISHHMRKLTEAGIVNATSDAQRQWYTLNMDFLSDSRKVPLSQVPTPINEPESDEERFRAKVLRDFFNGERLKEIPAQRKRRVIVLQHIVERFQPGLTYPEREVNDMLRLAHEDVATLRRELVDSSGIAAFTSSPRALRTGVPTSCRKSLATRTSGFAPWLVESSKLAIPRTRSERRSERSQRSRITINAPS
jgi:biotin operon repressor